MNILPSSDQQEILSVIESFLNNELPVSRYRDRTVEEAVYDNDIWMQLVELGWFGISSPAALGGAELGFPDEMLMYLEAGKQLASVSLLATSMAVKAAIAMGNEELAAAFISGEKRASLALPVVLEMSGDDASGKLQVFDATGSDYIFCLNGEVVLLVEIEKLGSLETLPGMDSSSALSEVSLNAAPVQQVSSQENSLAEEYQLLLCAMLSGIASAAMDMSVEYSIEREQFGQPIGSFQAIQHICADMAVLSDASRYQIYMACLSHHEGLENASVQLSAAVIMSLKAADNNTRQNIQVHGGMGFTEECNAHHYLKRKFVLEKLLRVVANPIEKLLAA